MKKLGNTFHTFLKMDLPVALDHSVGDLLPPIMYGLMQERGIVLVEDDLGLSV